MRAVIRLLEESEMHCSLIRIHYSTEMIKRILPDDPELHMVAELIPLLDSGTESPYLQFYLHIIDLIENQRPQIWSIEDNEAAIRILEQHDTEGFIDEIYGGH